MNDETKTNEHEEPCPLCGCTLANCECPASESAQIACLRLEAKEARTEKSDEELAAAASEIADTALALDATLHVGPSRWPGSAVGAIIGAFRPRTLVDPEDLVGRPVVGRPSTIHLEDAMHHWRLEPEDVLGWREEQEIELVLVTAGGKKLRWPDDMDVELTDGDRGRPVKPANRVFAEGYLRRDATKDPQV